MISLESFLKYQRLVFSRQEISFLSFFLLDLHNFHLPGPQLQNGIIHSLQGTGFTSNTAAIWARPGQGERREGDWKGKLFIFGTFGPMLRGRRD